MAAIRKPHSSTAYLFATLAGLLAAGSVHATDLLYVNRCAGGCTVFAGPDNAQTETSSLLLGTSSIDAFPHGDAVFNASVACLANAFAPFNVAVVTSKPATPHHQLILAGTAAQAGQASILGIAPYAPGTVINNAIAFAFATDIGSDPPTLCWIGAQQVASLFGLDHEFSCADLTSSLATCPIAGKSFTDVDAPCGDFSARACFDGPAVTTQNSHQLLAARAGLNLLFANSFEQ